MDISPSDIIYINNLNEDMTEEGDFDVVNIDISPSDTIYINILNEDMKEEGDFDAVNIDISPSDTIYINDNLNEETHGEDPPQQPEEKKRKKRKRGGQLRRKTPEWKRMYNKRRRAKKREKKRAMMAAATTSSEPGFTPQEREGHTADTTEHSADINRQPHMTYDTSYDGSKVKPEGSGLTPLHVCAQEDQVGAAAVLVQNGANVNAVSKAGYTPLHVACYYGNTDMVRFLLENGASVNAGTGGGGEEDYSRAAGGRKHCQARFKMPPGGEE